MLELSKKRIHILIITALTVSGLPQTAQALDINNDENKLVDYEWNLGGINTLQVGRTTNGTLTVTNGGNVTASLINIGRNGAEGQVHIVDGGVLNINNNNNYSYPLAVGGEGSSGNGSLGSSALMRISGTGSQVNINGGGGELSVGSQGARGTLDINNGGRMTVSSGEMYIGSRGTTDSKGVVLIDGAGSELFVKERVLIGTYNDGQMLISNGGVLRTDDYLSVGRTADTRTADSLLTVTGQGSLAQSAGVTTIGSLGKGTVIVADNGRLTASQVNVAELAGSTGELAIGNRRSQAAAAAGVVDTGVIQFGVGQGALVFNHTDADYVFAPTIRGNGRVDLLSGSTTLTGVNTYTGATTVSAGAVLQAGATQTFSANSAHTVEAGGQINLNGHDQTVAALTNAGTVILGGNNATPGARLTVSGNYNGNDGLLVLNSAIGDDQSPSDRLVINGNASGTTRVAVNNLGGHGSQTVEGLQIVQVGGTSDQQAFSQQGRIVAGAYDYTLVKGNASQTDTEGWYLTSAYQPPPTITPPVTPTDPEPAPEPGQTPDPAPAPSPGGQTDQNDSGWNVRPEASAYLANLAAANNMARLRLQDRLGETRYIDQLSGEERVTSVWLRQEYGRNSFKDTSGQLSASGNRTIVQIGGDLARWYGRDSSRFQLGIMGGYGNADSHTTSSRSGYGTSGNLHGYNVGIYGTWFANSTDQSGPYLDSWLTWADYRTRTQGDGIETEFDRLSGLTASLETGYAWQVGQTGNRSVWLQPQAQVTWMGIDGDHVESNGTRISSDGGNVQTRLGIRAYLRDNTETGATRIQPYLETNWLYNSKPNQIQMDDTIVTQNGARHIGEVKLGLEVNHNRHTSFWVNLAQQFGGSFRDTSAMLGVKYSF